MAARMEVLFFMTLLLCSFTYHKDLENTEKEKVNDVLIQSPIKSNSNGSIQKQVNSQSAKHKKIEIHSKSLDKKKVNVFDKIENIRKQRKAEMIEARKKHAESRRKKNELAKEILNIHSDEKKPLNGNKPSNDSPPRYKSIGRENNHTILDLTKTKQRDISKDFYMLILSPFFKVSIILVAILFCYIAFKYFIDKKIDQSIQIIKELKKRKSLDESSMSNLEISKQECLQKEIKSYMPYLEYINEKRSKISESDNDLDKHFTGDESTLIFANETANESSDDHTEYLKLINTLDVAIDP